MASAKRVQGRDSGQLWGCVVPVLRAHESHSSLSVEASEGLFALPIFLVLLDRHRRRPYGRINLPLQLSGSCIEFRRQRCKSVAGIIVIDADPKPSGLIGLIA
jgi:hypothetical protein